MKKLVKLKVLAAALIIALFFVFSCAAKNSEPWGNEETGFVLTYHPEAGTTLKYEVTGEEQSAMEIMGNVQEESSKTKAEYFYTAKEIGVDKTLTLAMGYNSYSLTTENMQGVQNPDMSQYIGKELEVKLSSTGRYLEMKNQELFPPVGDSPGSMYAPLRAFFFGLPEQPVKINDTWTATDSYTDKAGENEMTMDESSKFTVLEKTVTITGTGITQGFDYTFTGKLLENGEMLFAYKEGHIVDVNSGGNLEATINIEAAGMEIPLTSTSKGTIKLIK